MSGAVGKIDGVRVWQRTFLDLHLDRVRFPDGSEGEQVLIHHPGAAAVLPVLGEPNDPDPELVLIRQYRYAVGGVLWEIPAGRLEAGELPVECAHRELKEETGYRCERMEPVTAFWTTPGFTNEKIHIFRASGLIAGDSAHESDEFIEQVLVRLSLAVKMIMAGEISDAKTIIAILAQAQATATTI